MQHFSFDLDAEFFEKAGEGDRDRRIAGIVSTDNLDRQSEVLLQEGLDFGPFLKSGWFNDNHSADTDAVLGYPAKVELRELSGGHRGWYVEGYLLKGTARADRIWDLARSLQKSDRRLGFSVEGTVVERDPSNPKIVRKAVVREVAITRCFPGDTLVSGAAEKVTRRWYSGPMVEIHLASGQKLTGTPNHPIFTDRGWVPLGELDERRDRVGYRRSDIGAFSGRSTVPISRTAISHHVDHVPPSIKEVFDLARLAESRRWISPAGERQFHGDGAGGEINVVLTDSALRDRFYAAFCQKFGEDALTVADKKAALLADTSAFLDVLAGLGFAPYGSVRSGSQSLTLGGRAEAAAPQLFLAPTASNAFSFGNVEDSLSSDSVTGGDRGRCLSQAIGFSDLIFKRVRQFCGHVYNLDTVHGWYEANGVIAHNCPVNEATALQVLAKSLSAGSAVTDPGVAPGEGFPLRRQSLEGGEPLRKKKRRRMRKAEAVALIKSLQPALSTGAAVKIVEFAMRNHRAEDWENGR